MTPPLLPLAQASGLTGAADADAVSASPTPLTSFGPLPSQATADERRVWAQQLPTAAKLFDRLSSSFDRDHLARQVSIANPHAPETRVNPRTLLKQGDGRSDMAGMQLHANWIGDHSNLLMAVPLEGEALAWATACFENEIGAVVTLGTFAEHERICPCMEFPIPLRVAGGQVDFKEAHLGYDNEGNPIVEEIGKAAKDFKAAYPETFAGFVRVDIGRNKVKWSEAKHELSNYAIPTPADQAIRPGLLLDFCRVLQDENSGRPIAFQSPHGDDRGAVFAAAHGLYQQFIKGEVDAHNLESRILQQCISLRGERSATLFSRPDHLASLLTMGAMMLARGRPKAAGTPVSMGAPEVVSDERKAKAAPPLRSALKGARAPAEGTTGKRAQLHFADGIPGGRPEVEMRPNRGRRSGPQTD